MAGFATVRNRFTGRRVLVFPSCAAGFAKAGLPRLVASRGDYLHLLLDNHTLVQQYLRDRHSGLLGTEALPAMPVFVGSWNEEFEGHALLPAAEHRALAERQRGGFDWLTAIREAYGWNHWAAH